MASADLPLAVGPPISQTLGLMLTDLTLSAPDPETLAAARQGASSALGANGLDVKAVRPLGRTALDLEIQAEPDVVIACVAPALAGTRVDYAAQRPSDRRPRLFLADMDSTIVGCECLDELADFAGVKAEVAAITDRSMRGELNFEAALRARVAMLKGLPTSALDACFNERVALNPGARVAVRTMAARGVRCVLVSGGFRPFTRRAAALAGFHADRGNEFLYDGAALAGAVVEPILGPDGKLEALLEEAKRLGASPSQAVCIGDGANDLAMIRAAGLGVSYRGKPVLAAAAAARIDHTDLTTLLYFQGVPERDFVTD